MSLRQFTHNSHIFDIFTHDEKQKFLLWKREFTVHSGIGKEIRNIGNIVPYLRIWLHQKPTMWRSTSGTQIVAPHNKKYPELLESVVVTTPHCLENIFLVWTAASQENLSNIFCGQYWGYPHFVWRDEETAIAEHVCKASWASDLMYWAIGPLAAQGGKSTSRSDPMHHIHRDSYHIFSICFCKWSPSKHTSDMLCRTPKLATSWHKSHPYLLGAPLQQNVFPFVLEFLNKCFLLALHMAGKQNFQAFFSDSNACVTYAVSFPLWTSPRQRNCPRPNLRFDLLRETRNLMPGNTAQWYAA